MVTNGVDTGCSHWEKSSAPPCVLTDILILILSLHHCLNAIRLQMFSHATVNNLTAGGTIVDNHKSSQNHKRSSEFQHHEKNGARFANRCVNVSVLAVRWRPLPYVSLLRSMTTTGICTSWTGDLPSFRACVRFRI